jgi:hypothetical protein
VITRCYITTSPPSNGRGRESKGRGRYSRDARCQRGCIPASRYGYTRFTVSNNILCLRLCHTNSRRSCRQALQTEVKGKRKQTLLQTTSIVERRTVLLKRIQRFREIQQVYMPGFDPKNSAHLERLSTAHPSSSIHVEDTKLYMPSDLSNTQRRLYCPGGLADMEDCLRFAEASDSLESLRHHLRTRSFTNRFKIANVTGQIHNTRA